MTMHAKVSTDSIGDLTIHMEGGFDYDNTLSIKKELENLMNENPASTITIDLGGVDFVGSSGIGLFVDTLKILNQKKSQIKLSNVRSEFLKVFKLYDFDALEAMIYQFENDDTENLAQNFAGRKRTFQN